MEKNQSRATMRQKEAPLNKKVIKWLNDLPRCLARKTKGGPANPGQLDVTGCLQGIRIEIEGKVGDNKPTKLQLKTIKEWQNVGAITGWYNTFEGAQKLVRSQALKYGIFI
jgi:hypothetical protein